MNTSMCYNLSKLHLFVKIHWMDNFYGISSVRYLAINLSMISLARNNHLLKPQLPHNASTCMPEGYECKFWISQNTRLKRFYHNSKTRTFVNSIDEWRNTWAALKTLINWIQAKETDVGIKFNKIRLNAKSKKTASMQHVNIGNINAYFHLRIHLYRQRRNLPWNQAVLRQETGNFLIQFFWVFNRIVFITFYFSRKKRVVNPIRVVRMIFDILQSVLIKIQYIIRNACAFENITKRQMYSFFYLCHIQVSQEN